MSVSPGDNQPKKFLKKGEGLRRFAAYNPLPPMTTKKEDHRRKTFVKFKIDTFYPDILNDESLNLSTEIPTIPPPKIIHTPIKPSRQALGAYNYNEERVPQQIAPKKPEEPKPEPAPSKRYNLRGGRKQKATFDLSTPQPGSCMLALHKHIQQIESTVNELKEKIKNCECGKLSPIEPPSNYTRKNTRSRAANVQTRPSANADNPSSRILDLLIDEIAQLRANFDELNLRRDTC